MRRLSLFILGSLFLASGPAAASFHTSSWIAWQKQQESTINLYGTNLDGLYIFAYHFAKSGDVIPASPWVDQMLSRYRTQTEGGRRPLFLTIVNDLAGESPNHAGDIRHNGPMIQAILSDP